MALQIRKITADKPVRAVIYGPPGVGKTSLAAGFPNPVFGCLTEDGAVGGLEFDSLDPVESFEQAIENIKALLEEEHDYHTFVTDALDGFEPMVWQHVLAQHPQNEKGKTVEAIEDYGYGKGYLLADDYWRKFIRGTNKLRDEKGMNIVFIAHSDIKRFDDPMVDAYDQYVMRLQKRAVALIEDNVDAVLFLNNDAAVARDKENFKKADEGRVRGDGGGMVFIHTESRPAFRAKNRYNMPAKIPYLKGKGIEELGKYVPISGL